MLLGFFAAVAIVVVGVIVGLIRLTRMWLQSENEKVTRVLDEVLGLAKLSVLAMLLYALGPGIGAWVRSGFAWVVGVMP